MARPMHVPTTWTEVATAVTGAAKYWLAIGVIISLLSIVNITLAGSLHSRIFWIISAVFWAAMAVTAILKPGAFDRKRRM